MSTSQPRRRFRLKVWIWLSRKPHTHLTLSGVWCPALDFKKQQKDGLVAAHRLSQSTSTEERPPGAGSCPTRPWRFRLSSGSGLLQSTASSAACVFPEVGCCILHSSEGKLWSELEVHSSQISWDHSPFWTQSRGRRTADAFYLLTLKNKRLFYGLDGNTSRKQQSEETQTVQG